MSKEIEMQVVGTDGNYEVILPVPATHASSHSSNGTDPINEIREQHNGLAQKFWRGTQAEYDALTTKDEDTMYIITDASSAASGDMLKEVYDTEKKNTDIFKYVDTHANNNTIHVTADERNAWNAKLDSFTETDPTVPDWAKQATKPSYTASEVGALPSSTVIPSKTSQLTNDSGFITGYTETDPTVPEWAKQATKPTYTASEVGALPSSTVIPSKTSQLTNDSGYITGYTETDPTVPDWAKAESKPTYTASEAGALPSSTVIPSKTSQLTNDSGFITGYTETDPTVPAWAKAASKPSYTANEVGAIPTSASCNKNWNWSGQGGQPSWLWGGEDGTNMYVYNPSNFSVNYANSANYANGAGNADTVDGWHMNLDPGSWGIKPHCAGTGGMTSGSTGLSNGHIYMQYE